jgi:hypothetical protein
MNINRNYQAEGSYSRLGSFNHETMNLIVYFGRFKFPKPGHLSANLDAEKSTTHSLLKKIFQT